MNPEERLQILELIAEGKQQLLVRKKSLDLRKSAFSIYISTPIVKNAFDTRRINQSVEYNPRRGLQNYNRSEEFISQGTEIRLRTFSKLKTVLDSVRAEYERDPAWLDSYARVLLNTIDIALRVKQNDDDFSDSQMSMGNLNYIEQLLDVRYRLTLDGIEKTAAEDLKAILMSKDDFITKESRGIFEIKKSDVTKDGYDGLLDKLFSGARATKENPEVERTVTITIKDKFVK